jgi:hypothetical protein
MRVAGNTRRVPYKIMPDIEEPERFVIAQRDPDTEELVPQMRRGAKRFVEKNARYLSIAVKPFFDFRRPRLWTLLGLFSSAASALVCLYTSRCFQRRSMIRIHFKRPCP